MALGLLILCSKGFAQYIVGMSEFSDDLPEFLDDVSTYIPENFQKLTY